MAEIKLYRETAVAAVIDDNATLADATRAAGDWDNDGTTSDSDLAIEAIAYLQVQWDSGTPTAGDEIAQLWVLPGDSAGTYPDGGDAAIGTDDDPSGHFFVGTFVSVNPSATVNEVCGIPGIKLYPDGNRFVLKNTSGGVFDSTWQLSLSVYKYQSV